MAGRGKESALDLAKFVDKSIRVKLAGGREGEIAVTQPKPLPLPLARRSADTAHSLKPMMPSFAVVGVLKGYDQLLNLVLDEAVEYLRGATGPAPGTAILRSKHIACSAVLAGPPPFSLPFLPRRS